MIKKFLSVLLTLAMIFSAQPAASFAAAVPAVPETVPAVVPLPQTDTRVNYPKWPTDDKKRSESFYIAENTSQVFRFERPLARAAISNPEICDITPLGKHELLVYAKKAGLANLMVWDEKYNIAAFDLQCILDIEKLKSVLDHIDPTSTLKVIPYNDSVAVYGQVETAANLKKVNDSINSFNAKAISHVQIREPKQVLLEVRFAEVNRTGAEDYGLDFEAFLTTGRHVSTFRSMYGGNAVNGDDVIRPSTRARNPFGTVETPAFGVPDTSGTVNLFADVLGKNFSYAPVLEWLVNRNMLKVIARPNVVAKDGEKAEFIVGGEFPIPIQTEDTISVTYKEYGTKLNFTPEILDKGVIRLTLETEMSELDFSTEVSLGGSTVPGIIKRQEKNVAELKDGETLLIGGMITQRISEVHSSLPFFGDLPLLDRLFKRKEYTRKDVELLVLVTPHIVSPFQLKNQKTYFTAEDIVRIEDSSNIYSPGFPDPQGDAMSEVLTQYESQNKWELGKAFEIEKEIKKVWEKMKKNPEPAVTPAAVTPIEISGSDAMASDAAEALSGISSSETTVFVATAPGMEPSGATSPDEDPQEAAMAEALALIPEETPLEFTADPFSEE